MHPHLSKFSLLFPTFSPACLKKGLNAGKEISGEMADEKIVSLIDKLAHLGLID
jgi:hypothetical protein